jgi:hypothetical protein
MPVGTSSNGRKYRDLEMNMVPVPKARVTVAAAPDATGHPHPDVPDGTRMIALSDDKDPTGPRLHFTRAEFTRFTESVVDGEFDDLLATDDEMMQAASEPGHPARSRSAGRVFGWSRLVVGDEWEQELVRLLRGFPWEKMPPGPGAV